MRRYVAGLRQGSSSTAQALALALAVSWVSTEALAERGYSDWGPAVNLAMDRQGILHCGVTEINSAADDTGPGISHDGLSLYFGSARGGAGLDIWIAQRESRHAPWLTPVNLGTTVNSTGTDNVVSFSRDGHWMFFNSNRPGSTLDVLGNPSVDIWASYRHNVHDDFAWETPFNLGPGVNGPGFDGGVTYIESAGHGAPLILFGSGPTLATTDIWVAELQRDGTFGAKRKVAGLNSPDPAVAEQRPSIRSDGLEIFYSSNGTTQGSQGGQDIWVAKRTNVYAEWDVTPLGPVVNTAASEMSPYLSADGLTLYFTSNRPGGCGGYDLYMTTRARLKDKELDEGRDHELQD